MLPSSSSGYSARPGSSLSVYRPPSSASARPHSRLSIRSHARHARSKLLPLSEALVTQVTGLEDKKDEADFRTAVDFVLKNLEATTLNKGAVSVDMGVMDKQISGHALKARLNSQDEVSKALETCYGTLKSHMDAAIDLDEGIKKTRLPDHLQLLIKLSQAPSSVTIQHASLYMHDFLHPPSAPTPLTWASIVAEEPFEGEHWEGLYGLPPGFVRRRERGDAPKKGTYDREKESERLDWDSRWSTPSLSPLNSRDLELDEDDDYDDSLYDPISSSEDQEQKDLHQPVDIPVKADMYGGPPYNYAHRREVEALKGKQYWRDDWKGDAAARVGKEFDIGDASTLGPTLNTTLRPQNDGTRILESSLGAFLQNERYINEEDAVREILMALQGRKNILLHWGNNDDSQEGTYKTIQPTPRLIHLSLSSQNSVISSISETATIVELLRRFASIVFEQSQAQAHSSSAGITRTLEAFADAVDTEVRALDIWCACKEEAMCRAWGGGGSSEGTDTRLVISLLRTENDLRNSFERTFEVLLNVIREVYPSFSITYSIFTTRGTSASRLSAALLDRLFENVQEHLERREAVTSEALMRVFVRTAEPVWGMIGRWLRDGMGIGVGVGVGGRSSGSQESELDDEFFIESSGVGLGTMGMGLLDPEFWKEGYTLRESEFLEVEGGKSRKVIPMFLEHVAEPVLGAGKAVGLLRALGVPSSTLGSVSEWTTFQQLVGPSSHSSSSPMISPPERAGHQDDGETLFSVSIDTLSRVVYDRLLPQCDVAGALLAHVLVDDCLLWPHLQAIEDLFLMRKGDAMSHFTDILFAKMDSMQSWGDFHFLNTAFNDIVEANTFPGAKPWVQTSLVRFSYRGVKDKDKTISRTIKAIDGLAVEYAIPFPLTYIFQPSTLSLYGEIFVFLIQIRRAKSVLERILVRGAARGERLKPELKAFYAMRSKLSWFVNTLLNFLTTYVIHAQILNFHEAFRCAKSLDEMIKFHDNHLEKIQGRCLLKSNTSSLHRAILSILDMCLQFSSFFVTFAGDKTTHDVSRLSLSMKRHRSRRQRRQRRNIIGFSLNPHDTLDTSDEDADDFGVVGNDAPEPSFSATSFSYTEDGLQVQMDKMSTELDSLVRFVRRGVESLAGGISEAAPAFGVLAFSLEDWDT